MPQIITNTAELSCNQGTATSKLNVTSQDFVTIEGKAMATEEDKHPCWRELVARAYYNKSVSLIPYQLLPPYLRNQCLNSLVNFFSLSKDIISNWALISF